jgi:5-methylthioadenosine/S-adenosylhomocysteine deaminase
MNVQRMLGAGVQLALGTDSSNTGGRHELFEVLRQMMTSGRAPGSDFSQWITPSQALHAATRGVGVLGQAHAKGTLEPGAAADLLLVDFESAGLISAPVSLEALACHGDARNVHSMMVDGEWLMRERVHLKFDVAGLAQKARAIAERLRAAMPLRANRIGGLHARFAEWSGAHYAGMACAHCGLTALRAPAP